MPELIRLHVSTAGSTTGTGIGKCSKHSLKASYEGASST